MNVTTTSGSRSGVPCPASTASARNGHSSIASRTTARSRTSIAAALDTTDIDDAPDLTHPALPMAQSLAAA
ncbi:MAG TPA: hypothetical protein VGA44_08780 [Steroidobacteraceae bacterium]